MSKHPTHDDVGNFAIRFGYVVGCLHEPNMRAYLLERGATEETIEAAFRAMVKLADEAFYRRGGE